LISKRAGNNIIVPNTLLTTKLNIPPLRPALVPRPKLVDKLNAGLDRRVILISAPAGLGKTTLVTEWLNQPSILPHTWLSLDQQDDEPIRFFRYLVGAFQNVYDDLGIE
jgi:LuxR family maltose regulon positive regulatory protein